MRPSRESRSASGSYGGGVGGVTGSLASGGVSGPARAHLTNSLGTSFAPTITGFSSAASAASTANSTASANGVASTARPTPPTNNLVAMTRAREGGGPRPSSAAGRYHFAQPYASILQPHTRETGGAPNVGVAGVGLTSTFGLGVGKRAGVHSATRQRFAQQQQQQSSSVAAAGSESDYFNGAVSITSAASHLGAAAPASSSYLHSRDGHFRRSPHGSFGSSGGLAAGVNSSAPGQSIREQLHNLALSSAPHPLSSPPAGESVVPSASPSPSPSPSDLGSDDDLSDRAASPRANARARPFSAISTHLGERTSTKHTGAAAASQGGTHTTDLSDGGVHHATQPTPSTPRTSARGQHASSSHATSGPSPSPSPSHLSRLHGGRTASASAAHARSTSGASSSSSSSSSTAASAAAQAQPSPPNPHEITIHVCDEARGVNEDFRCDRLLLIGGMSYFRSYLSATPSSGSSSNAAAPPPEEIDISVHCDVLIFRWLLQYIKWERHAGRISVPGKVSSSSSSGSVSRPSLDVGNVVSILISSEFLQMARLVEECLAFMREEMPAIVQTPVDLACISESSLERLATLFEDKEDTDFELERHDTDGPDDDDGDQGDDDEHTRKSREDRTSTGSIPDGVASLQLVGSHDRRDKVASRLWRMKLERLLSARSATQGGAASLTRCELCGHAVWRSLAAASANNSASDADTTLLDAADAEACPSPAARRRIDFHGRLISSHVPVASWSLKKYLLALRLRDVSWEQCWWAVYGWCHTAPGSCSHCGMRHIPYAQLLACRFHDQAPTWARRGATGRQLVHPCCGQPATPFDSNATTGCKTRMHSVTPRTRREKNVHAAVMAHLKQVTAQDEAPSIAAVAGAAVGTAGTTSGATNSTVVEQKKSISFATSPAPPAAPPSTKAPSSLDSYSVAPPKDEHDTNDDEFVADEWGDESDEEFEDDEDDAEDAAEAARRARARRHAASNERRGYARRTPSSQAGSTRRTSSFKPSSSPVSSSSSTLPARSLEVVSLAEQALAHLRDVLSPAEYQSIAASVQLPPEGPTRTTSAVGAAAAAAAAKRTSSSLRVPSGATRARGGGGGGSSGSSSASASASAASKKPKGILKASVVIPSASAAAIGVTINASPSLSPSASPTRGSAFPSSSPPRRRAGAAYQIDYLLEDDRQRMNSLVSSLTHNRHAANTNTSATTASANTSAANTNGHARSSSIGGTIPLDRAHSGTSHVAAGRTTSRF